MHDAKAVTRIDESRHEMDMIVADSNSDMYKCMCWLCQRMNTAQYQKNGSKLMHGDHSLRLQRIRVTMVDDA